MALRLSVVVLLTFGLAGPLTGAKLATFQKKQTQVGPEVPKHGVRQPLTGWFQKPEGAGDYQVDIPFPNLERPSVLSDYLPAGRDIPGLCGALAHTYADVTA